MGMLLEIDGKLIDSKTSYKYLGVHFDPTLTLATHFIKRPVKKLQAV